MFGIFVRYYAYTILLQDRAMQKYTSGFLRCVGLFPHPDIEGLYANAMFKAFQGRQLIMLHRCERPKGAFR